MKRLWAALLTVCLVMCLLPATAMAADDDFTIDANGVLIAYNGPGGDVVIPDGVTSIGDRVFERCTSLTNVTILGGVTQIGKFAFNCCTNLTSITIPDGVTSIGQQAFSGCTSLTSVIIPDSVTYIGGGAFYECSGLVGVTIPDRVTRIEASTFQRCTNLTSVTIPNGVTIIGKYAFSNCTNLTSVTIPDGVTSIGFYAFSGCSSLTNITIPDSVTSIDGDSFWDCTGLTSATISNSVTRIESNLFRGCISLTSITIPDSVTFISESVFRHCTSLTSVTIPNGVTNIGYYTFSDCTSLTDIYYDGTREQWETITIEDHNDSLSSATIHYNNTRTSDLPSEYIYDIINPGENIVLPIEKLDTVTDSVNASSAVTSLTSTMTTEQKNSATGADLATLYAETAVSKAASKKVAGDEIIINKAAVTDLEAVATQTSAAVETALVNGGVTTARLVSNTVTLTTDETGEITIKIDPDILTTQVDKIRMETPTYAITLKVADLKEDLASGIITITSEDVGSGFAPGNQNKKTTVKVNLPKGKTTNPVTLSLPTDKGDTTYQAVVKTDGSATSSKYNPATTTMDGKVNTSGSYTVQTNQKDFTDIANKSAEMQKAIRYLASKGIINGTSATTFSPDGTISRAEIAALLVRALGKLDNSATNSFTDVKRSDWYYSAAGSSQKTGLINGYPDGTFKGTTTIAKDQILAVAARVLKTEMGYKTPNNTSSYLGKYSDDVAAWAQPEVALATKENLVVYRVDGTFKGTGNMTRGDAAIIIYRLFQKMW